MSDQQSNDFLEKDYEEYRDHIATVDQEGKRVWIYPKKPKGRFTNARTYLSWVLLALLFGMPFIKINGDPIFLFNVLERKFILLGVLFTPQDFHLFVLAMLTFMVFVILFTVVFGRLFCGWVCPQTIFMEMVFRKIEYFIEGDANAQRRLNKAPWTREKIIKKISKQVIFFVIAVLVANTFLAYIIGVDEVFQIASEPVQQNLGGFIAMILFSFAFYFVFSYMREQVCVAICPYGRMQGVLLDKNSIVVAYDFVRGEPRGKIRKKKKKAAPKAASPAEKIQAAVAEPAAVETATPTLGDCIDCGMCVRVCPTGIDIRNGTQLECVNCTACIDACDEIMDKVDRPRGLIRYDSLEGIETKRNKIFTPRVIAYSVVLLVLLLVNVFLMSNRTQVETLILRTPGMIYQEVDENTLSNLYNYEIINKSDEELPIEFRLVNIDGNIKFIGQSPVAAPEEITKGAMLIELKKADLKDRKTKLIFEIYSGEKLIDETTTNFLGPMK
jgi:cytochrome c oxidase accessory protein FixG